MSASRPEALRRAVPADIPRLVEIRHAVRENRLSDPAKVTAPDYAAFMVHSPIWVWDEDGAVRGFAAADRRDGSIWALFVDPADERRGIGRALLAAACGTLRCDGRRVAVLTTESGSRAERVYRADGWRVVGRDARGELLFRKEL